MKFTTDLLRKGIYSYMYGTEGDTRLAFLYVIFFHKNEMITRDKMLAMFRGIKDGSLLKLKNTYHCKINDKWYNHEPMIDIFEEITKGAKFKYTVIDLEEFLKYINLYTSKNRNYCIDYTYSEFVKPVIDEITSHYDHTIDLAESFGVYSERGGFTRLRDFIPYGYCCPDCDGDYGYYKQCQWEHEVADNIKDKLKTAIIGYLKSKRTQHALIPDSKILIS